MWTITKNKKWEDLRNTYDWVVDMHGVQQDAKHHAEGDVAIHTQMVLEELRQLVAFKNLDAQKQEILWAAALLHDVEKRSTTITDDMGRISAPNHAKKGAFTARSILYRDIATDFYIREQIANLVRYHGLPIWLFNRPDPQKLVAKASLDVNTELLTMLATADMRGRICEDQDDMLYRVDCFREFCGESNCLGKSKQFETDHARINYFLKADADINYVPFDNPNFMVVMMSGLPGSGKDSFIKKHYADWPVISLDSLREKMKVSHGDTQGSGHVIQAAKVQAKVFLRKQQPFVWNATNITKQMREQLTDLFFTYRAAVRIEYIEVPYKVLTKQNQNREAVVPLAAIERMIDKLEPPVMSEAHEVNYHVS